ncbi:DNA-directed DNA/RNA polymerase mu [Periophthalmus magnuspinnatus]|uniref:DNA-directed DNA/RNA polymerase mu n=1 Tax=Periophthalmus magnuspinnatus TaxID=409849 RepID=UPI00145B878F|nr:DNA-directed DNA/RNA polymerase mu [Periophthalmus magnuspinnatus]
MMVPLKRRKVCGPVSDRGTTVKFPYVVIFLVERKMGASRRAFLSRLGRKNGFQVEDDFSDCVTHVISENNSADDVRTWLDLQQKGNVTVELLDICWYTESMEAGCPVEILAKHKLQEVQKVKEESVEFLIPSYACQRRTSLDNHNTNLTDALSHLAENAELNNEDGRAVAFRRAAAVLKALPVKVTSITQLRGLPCLGEHSQRVIKDVIENGVSSEVESTIHSERFKALKLLTGIFGVGAKTADRWFKEGIQNLTQLANSGHDLNRAQQAGLEHYYDLNQPVTKAEAEAIGDIVKKAVLDVLPGSEIILTGGFRRGKITGHDVDFLITHPDEGKEVGLVSKVVSWLTARGLLLYQKNTRNSYLESEDGPAQPPSNMDRFERCFSIFKLEKKEMHSKHLHPGTQSSDQKTSIEHLQYFQANDLSNSQMRPNRNWRAVRVDLVVSPISQFAFAVLGWTGSKLFERELRRWAGQVKSMSLSSHALYDNKQCKYLRATSEEEIFTHLGLEFIPPSERNA